LESYPTTGPDISFDGFRLSLLDVASASHALKRRRHRKLLPTLRIKLDVAFLRQL
jgi:hypothetical protein